MSTVYLRNIGWQYVYSTINHGDSTVENAVKEEYGSALDARVLCPDLKATTVEGFVRNSYKLE